MRKTIISNSLLVKSCSKIKYFQKSPCVKSPCNMFLFHLANTSRISENKCFLIPRGKSDSCQLTIFSFGVITARKRSFRKVIYLDLSVILFTWGVSLTDILLDRDPPGTETPPLAQTPPWTETLWTDTPRTVTSGRYASSWSAFFFLNHHTVVTCTDNSNNVNALQNTTCGYNYFWDLADRKATNFLIMAQAEIFPLTPCC